MKSSTTARREIKTEENDKAKNSYRGKATELFLRLLVLSQDHIELVDQKISRRSHALRSGDRRCDFVSYSAMKKERENTQSRLLRGRHLFFLEVHIL